MMQLFLLVSCGFELLMGSFWLDLWIERERGQTFGELLVWWKITCISCATYFEFQSRDIEIFLKERSVDTVWQWNYTCMRSSRDKLVEFGVIIDVITWFDVSFYRWREREYTRYGFVLFFKAENPWPNYLMWIDENDKQLTCALPLSLVRFVITLHMIFASISRSPDKSLIMSHALPVQIRHHSIVSMLDDKD